MKLTKELVNKYINYFFSTVVGFENQEIKHMPFNDSDNEFLSIAMDKVDRLTRKNGRLRTRVWSNCIFIFHQNEVEPVKIYLNKTSEIKKKDPYLFVRSYVYLVFVDVSNVNQMSLFDNHSIHIETKNFKIWYFNTKYEVKEETRKANLFGITLDEKEKIDDYIYLTNPVSEIERMKSANSDAVDCVRAFTGELELLEQTSQMLDKVRKELENNPNARVLVEGPARSGKTIIAATLLHLYEDSKFLLMNYFFYQAIVDGFNALSGLNTEEINTLVRNPELDFFIDLKNKNKIPKTLQNISKNLFFAIKQCDSEIDYSPTKEYFLNNIQKLTDSMSKVDFNDLHILKEVFEKTKKLEEFLKTSQEKNDFWAFGKDNLSELKSLIDDVLNKKYEDLKRLEDLICNTIEELIRNSKQRFFHHNINTKISSNVKDGCWITRGERTVSKMWSDQYQTKLIICDEVQRLGDISEMYGYDKFEEILQIVEHSKQTFFTGDKFQMLNSKYDRGIKEIDKVVKEHQQQLIKLNLPESVGIPPEIGLLMKYFTHPDSIKIEDLVEKWQTKRNFEIKFIKKNVDRLVDIFGNDSSNKRHFAAPMDSHWLDYNEKIVMQTSKREHPIISLQDHEKEYFAYKFPYFCNEEIMPDYILSAYELISREVESLYVHIPNFSKGQPHNNEWYKKHLYVLFTRATMRLVVNFENDNEFERMIKLVKNIKSKGAKVSVDFI